MYDCEQREQQCEFHIRDVKIMQVSKSNYLVVITERVIQKSEYAKE